MIECALRDPVKTNDIQLRLGSYTTSANDPESLDWILLLCYQWRTLQIRNQHAQQLTFGWRTVNIYISYRKTLVSWSCDRSVCTLSTHPPVLWLLRVYLSTYKLSKMMWENSNNTASSGTPSTKVLATAEDCCIDVIECARYVRENRSGSNPHI